MRYKIPILLPKEKRMRNHCKVIISISDSAGIVESDFVLAEGSMNFEFHIPDHIPYKYDKIDKNDFDGKVFEIKIEYSDNKKTRKEFIYPVPEKLS